MDRYVTSQILIYTFRELILPSVIPSQTPRNMGDIVTQMDLLSPVVIALEGGVADRKWLI